MAGFFVNIQCPMINIQIENPGNWWCTVK